MIPTFPTLAEVFASLPGGDATIKGDNGQNKIQGGALDELIIGRGGKDRLFGNEGNDEIRGGSGNDRMFGGDGDDLIKGGKGNDRSFGGDGNDYLIDTKGNNVMIGGAGDDAIKTGKGRDVLRGDDGNDFLFSGAGSDKIFAGEGDDVAYGGKGNDRIFGGDGDDALFGGKGHDRIFDGDGDDLLNGGRGNDKLFAHFGNDELIGGKGNDRLMVRSDGGEPIIAQDPDAPLYYPDHPLDDADDTLDGGAGADTFFFRLDIDATEEIARKHSDENGVIDWQAVAGENNALHDHWVNGTGDDWIKDFDRSEGDRIVIKGHTVTAGVEQIDVDDDGVADYSLITLTSNQGGNGGAHDQDALGTIRVDGDLITEADLKVDRMVFFGAHETIDDLTLA